MRLPSPRQVRVLYRTAFDDARRERLFLSGSAFLAVFGATRAVTSAMRRDLLPFGNVSAGGQHIHHQVFGVVMLVASGYGWLFLGPGGPQDDRRWARATTALYGAGCALTIDEFALLLNLEDVYWRSPWREAIDMGIVATSVISIGTWGRPFFASLLRELSASEG